MADRVVPGPVDSSRRPTNSVNIHTTKIFDCCRDKDCIEDLRVYPTVSSQAIINSAFSVRPESAQLIFASVNVDEISFNRGYYTVDVSYFYNVTGSTFPGGVPVRGLAVFDKRVILFGSEGRVKTFTSGPCSPGIMGYSDTPKAVVEAVDPIALNLRIAEGDCCASDRELRSIPEEIIEAIGEDLNLSNTGKKLYVTLGQFSIIRLERDAQLSLDDVEYFYPDKECIGSSDDDPCTLFGRVRFPVEEFFPPDSLPTDECYRDYV